MNNSDQTAIILGEIKLLEDELSLMQSRLQYLKGLVVTNTTEPAIPRDPFYNPVVSLYACPTVDGVYTAITSKTSYNGENNEKENET